MSADWTTCRVVRDRDGGLWQPDPVDDGWWMKPREGWALKTAELSRDLGPIVPVLDADGLPVVTAVGDLTLRHRGRTIRIGERVGVLSMLWADGQDVGVQIDQDPAGTVSLDTPCEVLP